MAKSHIQQGKSKKITKKLWGLMIQKAFLNAMNDPEVLEYRKRLLDYWEKTRSK